MNNVTFETLDLRLLFSLFRLAIDSGKVYNMKLENETNRQKQKQQLNVRYITKEGKFYMEHSTHVRPF